jgi:hypothetical protein
MGGILEVAGVDGFLGNLMTFYERADTESAAWRALVASWWERHRSNPVGTGDLFTLADGIDGFDFGRGTDKGRRTAFGMALGKKEDHIVSGYRIMRTGKRTHALWLLAAVTDPPTGGPDGWEPCGPLEPFGTPRTRASEDSRVVGGEKGSEGYQGTHEIDSGDWDSCVICGQEAVDCDQSGRPMCLAHLRYKEDEV